jgi:hypothetical protein
MYAEPRLELDANLLGDSLMTIRADKRGALLKLMNATGVKNEESLKAQLMSNDKFADLLKQFGVNLEALDAALAGVAAPAADPATLVQQHVQQALAPFINQQRSQAQHAQQQVQQQASTELERFASDPKHEFYDDVAPLMADILELAARNGQQMGLTDAYERATLMHEPVRRVIDARKQREATTKASVAARSARGAAVSVTPSTQAAVVPIQGGNNLRADIEAAFAQTQGR